MSATKHTPLIRLQAARSAYRLATEACPHWDYEGASGRAECCWRVVDAGAELRAAASRAKGGTG